MWTLRRQAARVVLLDADDRVLLLEASDPASPARGVWWELPGGGIEGAEPSGAAAARELHEETGIDDIEMGPCVWRHHARFTFAGYNFDQHEHIHIARAGALARRAGEEAYNPAGLEALEAIAFRGLRWWTSEELGGFVGAGGKVIPPWLADQLPAVLGSGLPAEAIDMGEIGNAV